MAKKISNTKTTSSKTTSNTKKSAKVTRKSSVKSPAVNRAKSRKSVASSNKVDYYPNRMTFYVSFAAVVILFLLAILVTYNLYS